MNFHLNDATVEKLTSCVAVEKKDEVRNALKMLQDKTPLSQDVFVEVSRLLSWDQNPALREALEEDKEKVRIVQTLELQRTINARFEQFFN